VVRAGGVVLSLVAGLQASYGGGFGIYEAARGECDGRFDGRRADDASAITTTRPVSPSFPVAGDGGATFIRPPLEVETTIPEWAQ